MTIPARFSIDDAAGHRGAARVAARGAAAELQRLVHDTVCLVPLSWAAPELDIASDAVCERLRHLCAYARWSRVPVERVLVLLKAAWRQHPAMRGMSRTDTESLLERVVTLCIREYFRHPSPS